MKAIIDALKGRAWQAIQDLNRLGGEIIDHREERQALEALEDQLEKLGADGTIDPGELAQILQAFGALGVDSSGIEDLYRTLGGDLSSDGGRRLEEELKDRLASAIARSSDLATERSFAVQLAMNELGTTVRVASETSAAEHRAYMTVIGNMKA